MRAHCSSVAHLKTTTRCSPPCPLLQRRSAAEFPVQVGPARSSVRDRLHDVDQCNGNLRQRHGAGRCRRVRGDAAERRKLHRLVLAAFLFLQGLRPRPPAPDFGPNVLIFDSTMSSATIQGKLDAIAGTDEFGTNRYAVLFKPGTYSNLTVNVGYYMQVLGLGLTPDAVTINGNVQCRDGGSALVNFWRSVENLSVVPSGGSMIWAVSQASPLRRIHVKGSLALSDGGYTSGGYLGDSVVDNQISSGSQQQWMSRNSQWGKPETGRKLEHGVCRRRQRPRRLLFPNPPPTTTVPQTPLVREKPFLTIDASGNYSVFVPALRTNSQGTDWSTGTPAGQSIPIGQFLHRESRKATPPRRSTQALSQGKNLILTPGIYNLNSSIQVTRPNTIVLGLGLATLVVRRRISRHNHGRRGRRANRRHYLPGRRERIARSPPNRTDRKRRASRRSNLAIRHLRTRRRQRPRQRAFAVSVHK